MAMNSSKTGNRTMSKSLSRASRAVEASYFSCWWSYCKPQYQQRLGGNSGDWTLQDLLIPYSGLHLERSLKLRYQRRHNTWSSSLPVISPGSFDGLPPEIVKLASENSFVGYFNELLLQCWEEGTIPKDMRDA
ncbi:hypothetical protein RRG08_039376 [Elysia crispata]|uniref:Uncharacterized protein n=1 Tax=Elysia crispata TaxID=231223 RepID=A0AAE1CMZ8_9GAST|nr:hypothetical protein RRG08_039376 [Elysia crispata]